MKRIISIGGGEIRNKTTLKIDEYVANLAKKHCEIVKTEYEAYKIKAEIGMITNNDLIEKADELTECENTYDNALLNQKLAVEKYYYDIKIGL